MLDRQAQSTAHSHQLAKDDPVDFQHPQAQVEQAKGVIVVVGINFGQQSGRASVRREELDHGLRIEVRFCKDSRP